MNFVKVVDCTRNVNFNDNDNNNDKISLHSQYDVIKKQTPEYNWVFFKIMPLDIFQWGQNSLL